LNEALMGFEVSVYQDNFFISFSLPFFLHFLSLSNSKETKKDVSCENHSNVTDLTHFALHFRSTPCLNFSIRKMI